MDTMGFHSLLLDLASKLEDHERLRKELSEIVLELIKHYVQERLIFLDDHLEELLEEKKNHTFLLTLKNRLMAQGQRRPILYVGNRTPGRKARPVSWIL